MKQTNLRRIIVVMVMAMVLLTGCGRQKLKNVPPADEGVLTSWHADINVNRVDPGTVLIHDNLGSHSVTVSVPVLDADLDYILRRSGVVCVEVHYQYNNGRLEPAYPEEPEASAVYYFLRRQDITDGVGIDWEDQGKDGPMYIGTKLDHPIFTLKLTAVCCDGNPTVAKEVVLQDGFGNFDKAEYTGTTFTDTSLHTLSFDVEDVSGEL